MIVVIGSGIAGTAAALAASARHAPVRVIDGGAGATAIGSGALDGDAPIGDAARAVLEALSLVDVAPSILATTAGVLRHAAGADRALLRIEPRSTVFVPETSHPRWRGELLARHWNVSALARDHAIRFVTQKVSLLQGEAEQAMGDVELAACHDDPARIEALAARLAEALARTEPRATAIALPPWLGAREARAAKLSALVGVRCGEVLGDPAGPAGERFVFARDAAFARASIRSTRGRVAAFARDDSGLFVTLQSGDVIRASAIVVAIGGLTGGGVRYTPSAAIAATALPPHPRSTFTLSLESTLAIGLDGRPFLVPGSMFGIAPEELAFPYAASTIMERVGVLVASAGEGVHIAGDALEGAPRTWLEALSRGAAAGLAAAGGGPTITS
ncbi:hypothetical protein BH09MYX1_BH09MYX1_06470 [soil metagenome]